MPSIPARIDHATVTFRLRIEDPRKIKAVREAIRPETIRAAHQRCAVTVRATNSIGKDTSLFLEFQATDLVSLRASLNVNLRLIATALKTLDALPGKPQKC